MADLDNKIINQIYLRNVPPPYETFQHVTFLEFMASWIKPERYLELGCRSGTSLIPISKYCKSVIGVDMNPPSYNVPPNAKIEVCATDSYFENTDDTIEYDMVFIDADHSYEQSLKDFMNVKDRVIEDGFVFMHDTYPYDIWMTSEDWSGTTWKAAKWIKNNLGNEWEVLTLPFNPGVTILKKMNIEKQLAWE